jgi:hypothetical protein
MAQDCWLHQAKYAAGLLIPASADMNLQPEINHLL